jgi:5-methylcytosine-specific restriction enzyme A
VKRRRACLCGAIDCKRHKPSWGWGSKPAWRQALYTSPRYKTNRAIAIKREPFCHWRLPGCTGRSTQADHLRPVSQGGDNSLANLVGSCQHCNEARGRATGNQIANANRERSRRDR